MTLSAKRLGERCGLTAEEMNILLKEEGFLSGEPGNYYPTEKGKLFVVEKGDDNGYGGYAFRGWSWFEQDERILEELDTSVENKRHIREKTSEERRRRRAEKAAESEAYWKKVNSRKEQPAEDTANTIESFNRQLKKVTKAKSVFPTDDSLFKMLYLAMKDITKKWTGRRQDWSRIYAQLVIYYGDRIPE